MVTERAFTSSGHHKSYREGAHRTAPPEQTLEKITRFTKAFGITRVANVTGLDSIGIPVVMVCRPNSRSLAVSQGKGYSLTAARVSGLMESIENFHAERLDLASRMLSYEDLYFRHKIIDVYALPRNKDKAFDPFVKIPWVAGYDFLNEEDVWIPLEIVHTDYTRPQPFTDNYFIRDSNGLASGNNLVEALNHGICEVVERDAVALWALRSEKDKAARRVDLSTVADNGCRQLLTLYRRAGILTGVWDITTDIGVPTFICKIIQEDDTPAQRVRPAMGSGSHPCKSVALSRALTEAAQSRLTFISGARDDQYRSLYDRHQEDKFHDRWLEDIAHGKPERSFDSIREYNGKFIEDDFRWLVSRLSATGLTQLAYVDLTRPEFGISVVKVIAPGLESPIGAGRKFWGARGQALMAQQKGGTS